MTRIFAVLAAIVCAQLTITGTTAEAAPPTVTQLASHVYANLYGIAVNASGVYVTGSTGILRDYSNDPANGVIGRIKLTGGAVKTLYSSANYVGSGHVAPFQIALDASGNLIWADPDAGPGTGASFESGTKSGAAPTQFFGICCGPSVLPGDGIGVAIWGGDIYFSDGTGGRIGVGPSGSSATQIGPTRYTPDFGTEAWSQIAISNGKIFIADSAQQRGAQNGVTIVQDQSASITPAVRWISLDGTSGFQTLTTKIPNPQGIVAVNSTLYVTSSNTIWEVNETTGKAKVLVTSPNFQDLQGIAYYKGALYVADSQNVFGPFSNGIASATQDSPGVVWKVVL